MAKRLQGWTEEKIARYIKEGRGQGEGIHYKPWLKIQDFPSKGRVHRIKGNKSGRIHHLFSDLERDYFYILDWVEEVLDIREQFPLVREETLQIAKEIGINHPVDSSTKTPIVMTTDFLITVRRGNELLLLARTIKPSEELQNKRAIEKFEIERVYWQRKSKDWGIVTEHELPGQLCRNLGMLHPLFDIPKEGRLLASHLVSFWGQMSYPDTLSEVLKQFEVLNGLEKGQALTIFKYLLATKQIAVDLNIPFRKTIRCSEVRIRQVDDLNTRCGT